MQAADTAIFIKFLLKDAGILINILAQFDCRVDTLSVNQKEKQPGNCYGAYYNIILSGWLGTGGSNIFGFSRYSLSCYNYNFIASLILIYEPNKWKATENAFPVSTPNSYNDSATVRNFPPSEFHQSGSSYLSESFLDILRSHKLRFAIELSDYPFSFSLGGWKHRSAKDRRMDYS